MTKGSGTHKAVWLHLLSQGGYSTIAELSEFVGVQRIDGVLFHMAQRGFVHKSRHDDRKNGIGYGITPSCKVPQSVTVSEVLAASGNFMDQEQP